MPELTVSDAISLIAALDDSTLLKWLVQTGATRIRFPQLVSAPRIKDHARASRFVANLPYWKSLMDKIHFDQNLKR